MIPSFFLLYLGPQLKAAKRHFIFRGLLGIFFIKSQNGEEKNVAEDIDDKEFVF